MKIFFFSPNKKKCLTVPKFAFGAKSTPLLVFPGDLIITSKRFTFKCTGLVYCQSWQFAAKKVAYHRLKQDNKKTAELWILFIFWKHYQNTKTLVCSVTNSELKISNIFTYKWHLTWNSLKLPILSWTYAVKDKGYFLINTKLVLSKPVSRKMFSAATVCLPKLSLWQ